MKKTVTILIFFISFNAFSQVGLDAIAKETCECINGKITDFSKASKTEIEGTLGVCMLQSYTAHSKELNGDDAVEITDSEGMKKFGEKVAMKMLSYCPNVIIELGKNAIDEDDNKVEATKAEATFIEGEIIAIKSEQFVTIQVKDENARIHNFLLLDYFKTASLYTNNEIKPKDKIKVTYSEIELYDPKTKEFRYFKIISDLEKK